MALSALRRPVTRLSIAVKWAGPVVMVSLEQADSMPFFASDDAGRSFFSSSFCASVGLSSCSINPIRYSLSPIESGSHSRQ